MKKKFSFLLGVVFFVNFQQIYASYPIRPVIIVSNFDAISIANRSAQSLASSNYERKLDVLNDMNNKAYKTEYENFSSKEKIKDLIKFGKAILNVDTSHKEKHLEPLFSLVDMLEQKQVQLNFLNAFYKTAAFAPLKHKFSLNLLTIIMHQIKATEKK